MHEYKLLINGELVTSDSYFPVLNPADETCIAECPQANQEHLGQAIFAAQNYFHHNTINWSQRVEIIKKWLQRIAEHKDELASLLTQEQGKPLTYAYNELNTVFQRGQMFCDLKIENEIIENTADSITQVVYQPLGIVAAITPWNYPLMIAAGKILMAFITGNAVILKPSPYTPLTSLRLAELGADLFPAGSVNLLSGTDELGATLINHNSIRKISFTGSIATGKKLFTNAAKYMQRLTLEMGGNDPAIIFADADIEQHLETIFWHAFANCGQICVATKRLFVHESKYDQVVEKLTELAKHIIIGNGLDEGVQMGPLNNLAQLNIIENLVAEAKTQGAYIHCGGERMGDKGYFYQPTIVTNVNDQTRLVKEEQFGPALPILKFSDEDEVIQRANDTQFGLASRIWCHPQRASQIAQRLQTGVTWANTAPGSIFAPFGGMKYSGIGREGGRWGLYSMLEAHTISSTK